MKKEEISQLDEEEIVQLTEEIIELKGLMREISKKLTRIETKIKRGFNSTSKISSSKESKTAFSEQKNDNLSPEQVLEVYEELRLKAKQGSEEEVKQKLSDLNLTDLSLLCSELGASVGGKSPSRKKMLDAIISRIKQSLMLSRHIDRNAL
jgi:cysteinyl-tRNA synthetase